MSANPALLSFAKMHGLGNDFVVIDARERPVVMTEQLARAIADRRTGVGCDQLIVVGASERADVSMRIFNQDGSEVDACGNATRCVPLFVGRDVTIETNAGLLEAHRQGNLVSVDMGEARTDWEQVPLAYAMDTLTMPVSWDDLPAPSAVSIGNPHVVFFVDALDDVDMARLGPLIEHDPLFPARVNVNFAQMLAPDHIRLVVWERGAGFTQACGTGACATAVSALRRRIAQGPVRVSLPGGDLLINWAPGGHISMTGPAAHVFDGTLDPTEFAPAA
ncbi:MULTISPECIES: diaminopimelate epimerase [Sphingobium]|uniref:diaminopimelate epimerase n=1 Tax=Sphingobium TaxID=165695 RepID=UPI0015EB5FD8|nr:MULTISPECIES: diaminopimelate epimerase [Sphingobium]MCW2361712.1 diaminopimelate epimerase [Sphingobium sp. B10D3B]MCW2401609.1 diaminopimelate epimerase [Sphingobium sp. B10D7B]MCW2408589.1 diaminopimelate epimerase [Sphingobium xanthum]